MLLWNRMFNPIVLLITGPAARNETTERITGYAAEAGLELRTAAEATEAISLLGPLAPIALLIGPEAAITAGDIAALRAHAPSLPLLLAGVPEPAGCECVVMPPGSTCDLRQALAGLRSATDDAGREELRGVNDDLAVILQGISDAITVQDATGRVLYANDAAARMTGFSSAEELIRTPVPEIRERLRMTDTSGRPVPVEDFPGRRALMGEESPEMVVRFALFPDGEERWAILKAGPIFGDEGRVRFAVNIFRDITPQKLAEQRMQFLAEASEMLAGVLDYEETLGALADLAVPRVSDWCMISMVEEDGGINHLATAHADPARVALAEELMRRFPTETNPASGIMSVILSGTSILIPEVTGEILAAAAQSPEQLAIWRDIGFASLMIVPLPVRNRVIGTISFVISGPERRFDAMDLSLAEDLARRAAIAIDNAWLYRKAQQEIAVRTRTDREMRVSETRFRTMIEQSPLSTQIFSPDGYLIQANRAWEDLWLLDRGRLAGYNILRDSMLERTGLMPYVERAFAGEMVMIPQMLYDPPSYGRSGRARWVSAAIYPVLDDTSSVREVVLMLEDVSGRREAELAVRESEERFRTMADSAPVLIWVADSGGLCSYVNRAWLDFTGHTQQQESSSGWLEAIHPEDARRFGELLTAPDHPPFRMELRMRRADGAYRWLLTTGVPRVASGDLFTGYIGSCIDITDRLQAETELKRAKEAAEAASQAKDQFLAVLSHELRTPLTPVLTLTQVLKDEDLPEEIRPLVEIIHRNIELEARLIDDLLDLTRIEKGKLRLNLDAVDAHALLGNVADIYRSDIAAKKLHLALDLGAGSYQVKADSARLQQIFWNLIKNAVKFTPEGGTITVRSANTREGYLAVEVSDTGIGIDPEALPHIFDAFEQGGGSITRQFGGLGLGLAISKALAEMHGGTIAAASRGKGSGATFMVELKTLQTSAPAPAEPAAITATAQQPGFNILLVDDHEDTSKVMKVLLERRGYRVSVASTMNDGLQQALAGEYDLLISDIGLPDGSGLELMGALKQKGLELPAIALSGYGMEEDVRRSKEAGFIEHLTKPVGFRTLQEMIERIAAG